MVFTQGIQISHFCLQATCLAWNDIQVLLTKIIVGKGRIDQNCGNHNPQNPSQESVKGAHDFTNRLFSLEALKYSRLRDRPASLLMN